MRTTINLDDTVLAVIRATAQREGKTLGDVVEDVVRKTLMDQARPLISDRGIPVLREKIPGVVVTTEDIRRIRDEIGE